MRETLGGGEGASRMCPLYKQLSQNLSSYKLTISAEKLYLKQSLLKISNSFVPAEILAST